MGGDGLIDGRPHRFRHGVGRREAYGRPRVHTVTWLDGVPRVEGVEADDHARSRALLSRIKRADRAMARSLDEVPPGYDGSEIVTHREEIDSPYSPHGLAVKVGEDDLEAWARLVALRAALGARSASPSPVAAKLRESPPADGPSPGLAVILDLETMDIDRLASFLRLYETETGYDIDLNRAQTPASQPLATQSSRGGSPSFARLGSRHNSPASRG